MVKQYRTVVGFALALTASVPGYIILFFYVGATGAALVDVIGILAALLYLFHVRRFGFTVINVHVGLIILISVFLGLSYFTGGNHSPAVVWFTVVPYVALYALKRMYAFIWTALSVLVLIAAYASWYYGIKIGHDLDSQSMIIVWAFTILGVLATFFLLGLMAISADRNARQKIASEHQKSQIIHKAVDESGDAIILFDAEGNHIYQNRVLCDLFEFDSIEELNREDFIALFVDRSKAEEILENALRGGSWSGEFEAVAKSGRRFPAIFRTNAVFDDAGNCRALIAVLTDITRHKKVEQTLRESEEQYKLVAENTTDAIWLRDLSLNLVYISPSIEKMRGFTPQELMELPLDQNITPRSLAEVSETLERELALAFEDPEREVILETENFCKDGSVIWVEDSMKFIKDKYGKPYQIIGITRNITERKKAEDALKAVRAEMIENAHRAGMADIAAGTLHNVGNLLNSVKTSAHAASEKIEQFMISDFKNANQLLMNSLGNKADLIGDNPMEKKIMEYYTILEERFQADQFETLEELKRLQEKIDSITDVIASQQRFAGFSGFSEDYSLERLILDVLEIESPTLKAMGITIEKSFEELPKVSVQKTKLLHILVNLIKNAEDALKDIPKENRQINISLKKKDSDVMIKVTDSGMGISLENQSKIFNHGFTTKTNGYGFGLHSSAIYMDDMNGKIWMESEGEGKGTTFFLTLPLADS